MKKSEITDMLLFRTCYGNNDKKITKAQLKEIINLLFRYISTELSNGRKVEIRGFGWFSLKYRAAGKVRNPRNGNIHDSAAKYSVYFKAGNDLAQRVNNIYDNN